MGVVIVESASVLAIVFMTVFFVVLCRESRRITLCRILKLSEGEGLRNEGFNEIAAHAVVDAARFSRPSRAEAPAKLVTVQLGPGTVASSNVVDFPQDQSRLRVG